MRMDTDLILYTIICSLPTFDGDVAGVRCRAGQARHDWDLGAAQRLEGDLVLTWFIVDSRGHFGDDRG